jgi:hypothetical protein
MDISATIIATMVASIIGAGSGVFVGFYSLWDQRKQKLIAQVDRVVDLGIEYPYLENDEFCRNWPGEEINDEKYMRYDNYCCQVFNLLERIWQFSKGQPDTMRDFIYFEELIFRHKKWWFSEIENREGYERGFLIFVRSYLE